MHPILPFYAAFSLLALMGLTLRNIESRTYVWLAGWGAMTVVLVAVIFREVRGDTRRHLLVFEQRAEQSFEDMWASISGNWSFELMTWWLAQWGTNPIWLTLPITLVCIVMLRHSLRQLLGSVDTSIALLLYSAYPFFVFYVASGMKQALAMAVLMQAYVCFYRRRTLPGLVWLGLAPLFHTGAYLVYPFVVFHLLTWQRWFGYRRALIFAILSLMMCSALSLLGLNRLLVAPVEAVVDFDRRFEVYFLEADELGYRAGFRPDFTLFSFGPLLVGWWLRHQGRGLSLEISGWWLSLYALLACIYQLFAFAPFADRFATFGWFLIPAILVIMLADTGARRPRQVAVLTFALLNVLLLQFYTGRAIHVAI